MAYEIVNRGKAIRCLQCGMVSHHLEDVRRRWCQLCRMSDDDYGMLGLEAKRPKEPFRPGERIARHGVLYVVVYNEGYYGRVSDPAGNEVFPFYWFHEGAWCERT